MNTRPTIPAEIATVEARIQQDQEVLAALLRAAIIPLRLSMLRLRDVWKEAQRAVRAGRTVHLLYRKVPVVRFGPVPLDDRGRAMIPKTAQRWALSLVVRRLAEVVAIVAGRGEPVVLTYAGRPVGVLVPILDGA